MMINYAIFYFYWSKLNSNVKISIVEGIKYFIQGVNIFLDIFRRSILQAKINTTIVIQKYWLRFMFMHIKTQYNLG